MSKLSWSDQIVANVAATSFGTPDVGKAIKKTIEDLIITGFLIYVAFSLTNGWVFIGMMIVVALRIQKYLFLGFLSRVIVERQARLALINPLVLNENLRNKSILYSRKR